VEWLCILTAYTLRYPSDTRHFRASPQNSLFLSTAVFPSWRQASPSQSIIPNCKHYCNWFHLISVFVIWQSVPCVRQLVAGVAPSVCTVNRRPVHVGCRGSKNALKQVFLYVLWFLPVTAIPRALHNHLFTHLNRTIVLGISSVVKKALLHFSELDLIKIGSDISKNAQLGSLNSLSTSTGTCAVSSAKCLHPVLQIRITFCSNFIPTEHHILRGQHIKNFFFG
jgi:hypothetical protein